MSKEEEKNLEDIKDLILEVRDLKTYFYLDEGTVRAVDGANFAIERKQTLGVVGESGCGKSVTAQSILRIVPDPGEIVEGNIFFHRRLRASEGQPTEVIELTSMSARGREIRKIRGGEISMVFQEPMTSLSPVHTIGKQIMEAILLHQDVKEAEAKEIAIEVLRKVGMPKPKQTVDSYPYELSGGMRQRGMIAMALSCNPSLLIADEPTTALDVTTEAQILELMRTLQDDIGMAIMYITHDLGVVAEMSDKVVVMYLGRVVESADVKPLFYNPLHPYTRSLLKSIPRIGRKRGGRLEAIKGMVPDPYNIPPGCPFHPRCPEFIAGVCDRLEPKSIEAEMGHWVECHLYDDDITS
jgi:oligopeptide/dipeptide ABC transporter ATP-binding protein